MQDNSPKNKGVVISGGIGFGKSAIIEQLIEYSHFGEDNGGLIASPTHHGKLIQNQNQKRFI